MQVVTAMATGGGGGGGAAADDPPHPPHPPAAASGAVAEVGSGGSGGYDSTAVRQAGAQWAQMASARQTDKHLADPVQELVRDELEGVVARVDKMQITMQAHAAELTPFANVVSHVAVDKQLGADIVAFTKKKPLLGGCGMPVRAVTLIRKQTSQGATGLPSLIGTAAGGWKSRRAEHHSKNC
jgi:hypothetical protein